MSALQTHLKALDRLRREVDHLGIGLSRGLDEALDSAYGELLDSSGSNNVTSGDGDLVDSSAQYALRELNGALMQLRACLERRRGVPAQLFGDANDLYDAVSRQLSQYRSR